MINVNNDVLFLIDLIPEDSLEYGLATGIITACD